MTSSDWDKLESGNERMVASDCINFIRRTYDHNKTFDRAGCALGCGLMAGVFFAFSVSVMGGLGKLPASEGIAAMQAINVAIVNPLFLFAFLGTAICCVAAMLAGLWDLQNGMSRYLIAGGIFYLVGSILVTAVFNIPRNNALGMLDATDVASAEVWRGSMSYARCASLRASAK